MEGTIVPKLILLNGPKKSGKDTIALALIDALRSKGYIVSSDKLAKPLKAAVGAFAGLLNHEQKQMFENHEIKDSPNESFGGLTPREALISFSEEWAKPKFGKDIFGKLLKQRWEWEADGIVVVSDCGFVEEAEVFSRDEAAVVRLHRTGTNFDGDSRTYIDTGKIPCYDVLNDCEPAIVAEVILVKLSQFISNAKKDN